MKESDVVLRRDMVGGYLRANDLWVSDGVFMLAARRLQVREFLTCPCCLERLRPGQRVIHEMLDGGPTKILAQAENLKLFARSNVIELYGDTEYVLFRSEKPKHGLLLPRVLADGFDLETVWSPGPKGPAFDEEDRGEISLCVIAFEPGGQE